jgi:hypothetical protein
MASEALFLLTAAERPKPDGQSCGMSKSSWVQRTLGLGVEDARYWDHWMWLGRKAARFLDRPCFLDAKRAGGGVMMG